jgi:hypothetical protein
MAKTRKNPSAPPIKRRPLEERVTAAEAKASDLRMRLKIKDDPEKAKIARKIRGLRKEGDTPAMRAAIAELSAKL